MVIQINKKGITILMLVACFTLLCIPTLAGTTDNRLFGADRYKTAEAIAEAYNSGTVDSVVLVPGNSFANALPAGVLAYQKNAPILLIGETADQTTEAFEYLTSQLKKGGTVVVSENIVSNVKRLIQGQEQEHNELYNYLLIEGNRQIVIKRALQLNNGHYTNACVYFVAEALRQNGVDIPDATCNTLGLIAQLEDKGWTRSLDYKSLRPGDICFTTDQNHGQGAPAHTYVFMSSISPDNYDYAMICDNQADRYGNVYHKRNIVKLDVYKGEEKEPFHFFMRK